MLFVAILLVLLCFGDFWRVESKPLRLFGFLQDQTYSVDCAGYLKGGEEEGGMTLKERVPGEGGRDEGAVGRSMTSLQHSRREKQA